eukprot:1043402-Rhodomonas_salina.1
MCQKPFGDGYLSADLEAGDDGFVGVGGALRDREDVVCHARKPEIVRRHTERHDGREGERVRVKERGERESREREERE